MSNDNTANRLINESSTYLLQHAYNPVNWYPWSSEAIEQSIKLDKPIMLSIGYSACHWCHVMEEESFQDKETAEIINKYFIPIKVDREERPDIDDIYMTAVQLMTGQGGWPLTIFITPQLKPFYGGTYFPKENRHYGQSILPGFKTVLSAIHEAWEKQRHEIETNANEMTEAISSSINYLSQSNITHRAPIVKDSNLLIGAAEKLLPSFDKKWGGFGSAPKFPHSLALFVCLNAYCQLNKKEDKKASSFKEVLYTSLNGMANGGIYDHLGGGFCRYSTDEKWRIPHFEKMLYDNALLSDLYLQASLALENPTWKRIGCETLDFVKSELSNMDGAFYSSLDADSEGIEGKFYTWTKQEIDTLLGQDADVFCQTFHITGPGNFEHGQNILYLNIDQKLDDRTNNLKETLIAHRSKRIAPGKDEKILTSWNGLTISAFVRGYQTSGEERYLEEAKRAATFILKHLTTNNRLMRTFAKGKAKLNAYLDDYAFFTQSLIDLASVDPDPLWLNNALALTDSVMKYFWDDKSNDFFFNASDHEQLIARPQNNNDGPMPSAGSTAMFNLLKLARLTENTYYQQCAEQLLAKYRELLVKFPMQFANMVLAWDYTQNVPLNLVIVNSGNAEKDREILFTAHGSYLPQKLLIVKNNREEKFDKSLILLSDKHSIDQKPTVYICKGYTCQKPITDINELKVALKELLK